MDEDIRRMIKDAFELEGLLLLADSRGEEASQLLIDAIREKSESLASAAASLEISGGGEVEEDSNLSDFCTGGETSGDDSCIVAAEEEETPDAKATESEEETVSDISISLKYDGSKYSEFKVSVKGEEYKDVKVADAMKGITPPKAEEEEEP